MKRIFPLLLFLFLPFAAWAAVPTFDAVSLGTAVGSATVTSSHTLGGLCTNPYAVANLTFRLDTIGSVSTVSYGATSMVLLTGRTSPSGDQRIEKWGVANPPSGAQTVTGTLNVAHNSLTLTTRTYCGVHQTTSTGTAVNAIQSDATATIDVSSATDELVIDGVLVSSIGDPIVVGAGQTQRSNHAQDGGNHTQGTSDEAGAATTTMSWTLNTEDYWAIVAVALKPVTGGAAAPMISVIVVD